MNQDIRTKNGHSETNSLSDHDTFTTPTLPKISPPSDSTTSLPVNKDDKKEEPTKASSNMVVLEHVKLQDPITPNIKSKELPASQSKPAKDDWVINKSIEDPRSLKQRGFRLIDMPFKQSFSNLLSEVYFKQDEFVVGPFEASRILIFNLPLAATSDQIKSRFSDFGKVRNVEIPKCPITYSNLGIASITFEDGSLRSQEGYQSVMSVISLRRPVYIDNSPLTVKLDPKGDLLKQAIIDESAKVSSHFSRLIKPTLETESLGRDAGFRERANFSQDKPAHIQRREFSRPEGNPRFSQASNSNSQSFNEYNRPEVDSRFNRSHSKANGWGGHPKFNGTTNQLRQDNFHSSNGDSHSGINSQPSGPYNQPYNSRATPEAWRSTPTVFPEKQGYFNSSQRLPDLDPRDSPNRPGYMPQNNNPSWGSYNNNHHSRPPDSEPRTDGHFINNETKVEKVDYCIVYESKYLPLFITTEDELMVHFKAFSPKMVTKERRCWVIIFEDFVKADRCFQSPETKDFRGYRLLGKLQRLAEFRKPTFDHLIAKEPQPKIVVHKVLPSTGLPSFKKFTNSVRPTSSGVDTPNSCETPKAKSLLLKRGGALEEDRGSSIQFEGYSSAEEDKDQSTIPDPSKRYEGIKSTRPRAKRFKLDMFLDQMSPNHDAMSPTNQKVSELGTERLKSQLSSLSISKRAPSELDDPLNESDYESEMDPNINEAVDLPVHSTGSARTQGYYKVGPDLKKYRYKFSLAAAMRREAFRLGTWIPYSGAAKGLAQQLEDGASQIVLARSSIHDWGLFAVELIQRGDLVIEYVGELIRSHLADVRERDYMANGIDSSYLFRMDDEYVVDATTKGNVARFINHSCDPNCLARITRTDGRPRILIFAKKDIRKSEEITYDYQFPIEDEEHKIKCLCNAPTCRGYLN